MCPLVLYNYVLALRSMISELATFELVHIENPSVTFNSICGFSWAASSTCGCSCAIGSNLSLEPIVAVVAVLGAASFMCAAIARTTATTIHHASDDDNADNHGGNNMATQNNNTNQ